MENRKSAESWTENEYMITALFHNNAETFGGSFKSH